jgi:hypothetical protein
MPGDPETKEYVTFEIVARGPEGDSLEVEFADDQIILYGWLGSVVTLFHKLGASDPEHTPIPATPRREAEKSQEAGS